MNSIYLQNTCVRGPSVICSSLEREETELHWRLTGSVRVKAAALSSFCLRPESSILELTFTLAFSFSLFLPYLLPFKTVMISKTISIILMILHKEAFKQFLVMKNESLKHAFAQFIVSLYITVKKALPHLVTMQSIEKSSF